LFGFIETEILQSFGAMPMFETRTEKLLILKLESSFFEQNIHNTSFSPSLTNKPNKLERYITQGWKDLPGTNTLAYWAHS
jgi:hypothetical protein